MKTELNYYTAFRNSVPREKYVHWLHDIWYMYGNNVSLVIHLRAVADAFRPLRTHQRY